MPRSRPGSLQVLAHRPGALGVVSGRETAYVHDAGFGGFAPGLAPALLRLLRHAGIHGGLVVDLGCGSGASPPCTAVTSLGECVNYLFDETAGSLDTLGWPSARAGRAASRRGGS
jgi:hypothetical protein